MSSRILLIEDEPGLLIAIPDLLAGEGYEIETADDGEAVSRWRRRNVSMRLFST
jgi:CheY-like chemotaxis protein